MNRHRTYWSQMHDERKEPSVKEKHLTDLENNIKTMMLMYGKDEIVTLVRKLYTEIE